MTETERESLECCSRSNLLLNESLCLYSSETNAVGPSTDKLIGSCSSSSGGNLAKCKVAGRPSWLVSARLAAFGKESVRSDLASGVFLLVVVLDLCPIGREHPHSVGEIHPGAVSLKQSPATATTCVGDLCECSVAVCRSCCCKRIAVSPSYECFLCSGCRGGCRRGCWRRSRRRGGSWGIVG